MKPVDLAIVIAAFGIAWGLQHAPAITGGGILATLIIAGVVAMLVFAARLFFPRR
jgi:hypothetical protein